MLLGEDHRAVQDAVRAYVQERIAPHAARWDKEAHFPAAELRGLAALGCYGVAVPAEWLSEIYLTPDFGISVVTDPELARFEFKPVTAFTNFGKVFQFKTMDGFQFEPHCYYKVL